MSVTTASELLLCAAVSGRFDPFRLLEGVPEERFSELAGQIAGECDEELAGGRHRWILRASARRAALGSLSERATLRRILREAPPVEDKDAFAVHLRRILAGNLGAGGSHMRGTDEARHLALQFAKDVPLLSRRRDALLQALDDARDRIARKERLDSLAMILPPHRPLIGRQQETRKLKQFARGALQDPRPIIVSGIGGVGKSALLAGIIRSWTNRRGTPTVILLDFDRPALAGADPFEIIREMTRQLAIEGFQAARNADDLQALHEIRTGLSVLREVASDDGDASAGVQMLRITPEEQFAMLLSKAFQPFVERLSQTVREQPILLVLDTFEVVAVLGNAAIGRILDLEQALRERAGFSGLRTVISGRSLEQPLGQHIDRLAPRSDWVELRGLKPPDGAAFLASMDVAGRFPDKEQRTIASQALGGHPLALLVLELYARERSDEDVAELLEDLSKSEGLSAEFAQRFLYSRILDRISDPEIKILAHPGLVLRRVSSHLIRCVLAGPCGLGDIDQPRSVGLFDKLKRQYWLVDELGPDLVRHRPDLRRLMLAGLFAGPRAEDLPEVAARKSELAEKSKAVSLAAARFFETPPPETDPAFGFWSDMGEEARRVERAYHLALTGAEPPDLTFDEALAFERHLGEAVEELPAAWRAIIKVRALSATLSEVERANLSSDLRAIAEEAEAGRLLHQSDYEAVRTQASHAREQMLDSAAPFDEAEAGPDRDIAGEEHEEKKRHEPVYDGEDSSTYIEPLSEQVLSSLENQVIANFSDGYVREAADLGENLLHSFQQQNPYWSIAPSTKFGYALFFRSALWQAALTYSALKGDMGSKFPLTDFGAKTYDQLNAILLTHLILNERLPERFLSSPEMLDELKNRRQRTGTVERSRAFAVASRLIPNFWSEFDYAELSVETPRLLPPDSPNFAGSPETRSELPGLRLELHIPGSERSWPAFPRLRDLDALYEKPAVLSITRTKGEIDFQSLFSGLRGLTPELHAPTARLFSRLGDEAALTILERLSRDPFWPVDFIFSSNATPAGSKAGTEALRYSTRDAQLIAVTADRCGALRRLIEQIATYDTQAQSLLAIHDLITNRLFDRPRDSTFTNKI